MDGDRSMTYKCALLCMHGMGNLSQNEFNNEIAKVRQSISSRIPHNKFSNLYIPKSGIFYNSLVQGQENKVWNSMLSNGGLDSGWIRRKTWGWCREKIISHLADVTAFTMYNTSAGNNLYNDVQNKIYESVKDVYDNHGNIPIVILSHSLGSQILSSYIWDAQNYLCKNTDDNKQPTNPNSFWNKHRPVENDAFLCLQSLKDWFTTGCNIPVFVSGFKDVRAIHTRKNNYDFNWFNYFDYDDVLGYPLSPLDVLFDHSNKTGYGQSYANAVTDIQVNANSGLWGAILSSWNPFSHEQYWGDKRILNDLSRTLLNYL